MRQFEPSTHAGEVRRCARCGKAAVVCVREWKHRILGLDTPGRTLELECRSCRARVTLHSPRQIRVERLFAFVMLPAIFPSIWFFASARRKARAWSDNPVVEGVAPPPPPPEEPRRACAACHGSAHCVEVARRQTPWAVIGVRRRYVCSRCASSFVVHDARAVAFSLSAGIVLAAMGALIVAFPPGSAVGAESSNRAVGFGLLALAAYAFATFVLRLRAWRAHPIVE